MIEIRLKRAYEPAARSDGRRILVERLWPRGIKKEALQISAWMKDVAPDTELRKWFSHDPKKWSEFQKRYFAQLDAHPGNWRPLIEKSSRVTLVYSSHDQEHNNAVALRDYLQAKLKSSEAQRAKGKRISSRLLKNYC